MRKNSAHAVVAAAVNASVASGVLASVVASAELSVDKTLELSSFHCSDCSTRFGAIAGTKPFCITCGSEDVEDLEQDSDAPDVLDDDEQLTAITCAVCGTHNIMRDSVVAALDGYAHCVQCGADLPYVLPDDAADEDTAELPTVDPLGTDDVAAGVDDQNNGVDTSVPDPDAVDNNSAQDAPKPQPDVDANNTVTSGDEITEDDVVEVNLDSTFEEQPNDEFDVVETTTDSCLALVNGVPVATASRSKVGASYGSPGWIRAVKHTVRDKGRKAAFATFKFEPLVIPVALKPIAQARIDKMLATKTAAVEASVKDMREDYTQCLAIALAGINKGFWRQTANALKSGLFEELSAAGVNKPEQLIDRVFARDGRSFLQTVTSKADELRTLSLAVRNELAQQVEASNYMAVATEDTDDEDDADSMDVTARLRGQGMRTKSVASVLTSAAPLKSTLAGRKLF
jgi:hypothetical protein